MHAYLYSRSLSLTKSDVKSCIVFNNGQSKVVNKIRAKPRSWLIFVAIDITLDKATV